MANRGRPKKIENPTQTITEEAINTIREDKVSITEIDQRDVLGFRALNHNKTVFIEYQQDLDGLVELEKRIYKVADKEKWFNYRSGNCWMYTLEIYEGN